MDEVAAAESDDDFRAGVRSWLAGALQAFRARLGGRSAHDVDARRSWDEIVCGAGWAGLSWPAEFGGCGLSLARQAIFHEEHARSGAPLPVNALGQDILGPILIRHGTAAQKTRFLPRILSNEDLWCQGYSEPSAGSDLASLQLRAVREGEVFRLTGQKIWTSFADIAHWCFALVRTDSEAARHRGISFLLVDMSSPGVTVRPIRQMHGAREFCEVFFDDVEVPAANLVGQVNEGWRIAMEAASFERSTYFLPRLVRMQSELAAIVRLSAPALRDPVMLARLSRSFVDVYLLRLHAYGMLERSIRREPHGPESSFIKLMWSESHQRLLDLAMDVLGRAAQLGPDEAAADGREWQRDYLWSRAETILAGTSEIQRNIIAERMLGLPR